ncbi:murein transglycosylase A [Sphingomonas sp. 37zxx]|uniref:murein transglycosylase A n=1 Tax=Sphingomonas sp. 37zxx TaxID=1550073 RepID=UPI00053BDE70|nr:murein transglycosylase A [Sphingomonas sp. 37zxx]
MRALGGIALAVVLASCTNAIVPNGIEPGRAVLPGGPAAGADVARNPVAARPLAPVDAPEAPAAASSASVAGVVAGPLIASLPIDVAGAERALAAFRISCSSLQKRNDASGLTRGADWAKPCAEAQRAGNARAFFAANFETVQIADGRAFATGYYEPEIRGARVRQTGYETPVYAKPADLIEADMGLFASDLADRKFRGRVRNGAFVPYYDRTQIESGALAGKGLEIAWAADPIELFFLQVQGSGRLRLPDGSVMRIGYASQNGQPYTGIGKLMRDRGLLQPGQASMQGIMAYLRANPAEGQAVMRENKSYVFFRELTGPGPLGALGLPVSAQASVAADPRFVPLGAPVFLSMDRPDANGIWVAQDTGGAIKGANRFDTFWGAGEDARAIAGGMSARGTAFILVPRGTLARLRSAQPTP